MKAYRTVKKEWGNLYVIFDLINADKSKYMARHVWTKPLFTTADNAIELFRALETDV